MFIKLSKIVSDPAIDRERDRYADTDEPDENVVVQLPAMVTTPVSINVNCIRCFYTRKDNRVGTRITFSDGGGFAVSESYDEVCGLVMPPGFVS